MRIRQEDYDALLRAVRVVAVRMPDMREDYWNQGMSLRRFHWDALWRSGVDTRRLYAYLSDDHIDTALRRVCATVWPIRTNG